jgi:UbiD family decarboxylase
MPDVIKAFNLVDSGCRFLAIVQIRKRAGGQGKAVGAAVLASQKAWGLRTVIVVDEDIDPSNPDAVYWALGTRCDPAQDIDVLHNMPATRIDPLVPEQEWTSGQFRTSKMIIDCTRPVGDTTFEVCLPSLAARQLVEARWNEYGIPLDKRIPQAPLPHL